ncbi:hypothetical protein W02_34830 [Nitrospira sp. KM1]|uniref:Slp family lipoprotein n=1 Tax=Nitrospira sp. KM1 TaxID=1936990 RepID=UPI0013A71722|nr:Slp family lipoprotein [Nitrospira sp. KM1]BCA56343.1 hypothetical protein W02_34830 [Nitrospira sp. KM1]
MRTLTLGVICLIGAACSATPMFPPAITRDIEVVNFDFQDWKDKAYEGPYSTEAPQKVQLGGMILQAERQSGGVVILADRAPIVQHPRYGPGRKTGRASAMFTIYFNKVLDAAWIQPGNSFIVIGKTEGAKRLTIDDVPRTEPYLEAICIHLWKNQGRSLASFPFEAGGGYYPLEEQTFCN